MRTRLPKLLVCLLLVGAPSVASAQVDVDVDLGRVDLSANIGGQPIDSVDVFYDQLSPYGMWVDDPQFGTVFTPDDADYVPYTNGFWQYTDAGMMWVSNDPFGWATAHYGRWAFSQTYGRWVWMPDTTWGPAWVQWSEADGAYGWAPLGPDSSVVADYTPPDYAWHFAAAPNLFDHDVRRYYVPRERVVELRRDARPIERYGNAGGARVPVGPAPEKLRAQRVEVRPVKIDARASGRMSKAQLQEATKRAETQRAADEQKNRTRIERDAKMKTQAQPAAVPQPGRRPTPRVEPSKPRENAQPPATKPEPQRTEPGQKPEPPRTQPEPSRTREPQTMPPSNSAEPRPQRQPARQPEPRESRVPPSEPAQKPEPPRAQPEPPRAEPAQKPEPPRTQPEPRAQPEPRTQPEPKEAHQPPARHEPASQAKEPEPSHSEPSRTEPSRTPEQKSDRKKDHGKP